MAGRSGRPLAENWVVTREEPRVGYWVASWVGYLVGRWVATSAAHWAAYSAMRTAVSWVGSLVALTVDWSEKWAVRTAGNSAAYWAA